MGACLGHCFAKITNPFTYRYHRHTSIPFHEAEPVEVYQLTIDDEGSAAQSGTSKSLISLLSLKRFKKKHCVPVSLELVEENSWSRAFNKYSRLKNRNDASTSSGLNTPPQTLDARTLLRHQGCISSTPASSLDLEWEHEVVPPVAVYNLEVENTNGSPSHTSTNGSQPSNLTASPWSRGSTPNSLEWDPVEADMTCVDVETEQLLTEIERLTNRALKETGGWTDTN